MSPLCLPEIRAPSHAGRQGHVRQCIKASARDAYGTEAIERL
ncbi:hypothetical protein A176_005113 [Myxococcus hansupus]|uniref:Uncharacterized protein n=1 Tax=Pseudomyxococcus hansupus TaxID=1297742 RepID=A0A0H4WXR3_9BACT|nr:hypothetical protein A176_005113 [Myxococcus hansupus]